MPKRTYPPEVEAKRRAYSSAWAKRKRKEDSNYRKKISDVSLAYYHKNREKILLKSAAIRNFLNEKKSVPCVDCGIKYPPYVMDFDHVRGDKLFNLGSYGARAMGSIIAEISKCDVVCSNCHRERTQKRFLEKRS